MGVRGDGGREVLKRLEEELERLKHGLNVGYNLRIRWIPDDRSQLAGEVKGNVIYIYETDEDKAIETLKHEVIDHHMTHEVIQPLVEYINVQKRLIESLIYQRKEDLVDQIAKLL